MGLKLQTFGFAVFVLQYIGSSCAGAKGCPGGWTRFHVSCYKLSDDALNWTASQANCSQSSAHLVTISSEEENIFLKHHILLNPRADDGHCWIGLYRHPFDKTAWSWADGSRLTFTDWWPGQPDNDDRKEACGEFYHDNMRGMKWNDLSCFKAHYFICEKELFNLTSCSQDNGGCEHVCVSTVHGPQCRCKDGYVSSHDGKVCSDPSASARPQAAPQASHSFEVASFVLQLLSIILLIPVSCVLVSFYRRVSRQRRMSSKTHTVMINPPSPHADENGLVRTTSPLMDAPSDDVNENGNTSHV